MPDFTFSGGGQAVLSDDGSVLFVATITGPDSNLFNDHVLVIERPDGSREVLARENDQVPGFPQFRYRGGSANTPVFLEPVLSDTGEIGVTCEILDGTTVRTMVLTDAPLGPGLTPAVWGTQPVVADLGSSIDQIYKQSVSVHDGGLVTLMGLTFGTAEGTVQGAWFGSSLGITTFLQTNLPAPGFGPGIDVNNFEEDGFASNALGEVAFAATAVGPSLPGGFTRLIYSGDPTNLGILAQTGQAVPGLGGSTFARFIHDRSLRTNDAGALSFFANINTTTGPDGADVLRRRWSGSRLCYDGLGVAQIPGATYDIIGGRAEMNANAEILFNTRISGVPLSRDSALCIGSPAGIDFVVREGDLVEGHEVNEIGSSYFAINDRRDVVAIAPLDGESMPSSPYPGDGSPAQVLARQTEPLITDRGGFSLGAIVPWRINAKNGSTETGRPMALDNRGRFALNVIGGTGNWIVIFDIDGPCVGDLSKNGSIASSSPRSAPRTPTRI